MHLPSWDSSKFFNLFFSRHWQGGTQVRGARLLSLHRHLYLITTMHLFAIGLSLLSIVGIYMSYKGGVFTYHKEGEDISSFRYVKIHPKD
jgi:hypothetical protein